MGPKDEQGPQGEKGDPGIANVIYSDWLTFASWEKENRFETLTKYNIVHEEGITENVLDQGVVLVYIKWAQEYAGIEQLPLSLMGGIPQEYRFNIKPGELKILYYNTVDKGTYPIDLHPKNYFRYIIIPGGVKALSTERHSSLPDFSDYDAVCAY